MGSIISSKKVVRQKANKVSGFTGESWMNQLRTNSKIKKIYDVNPFVEVYQFRENFYGFFCRLVRR